MWRKKRKRQKKRRGGLEKEEEGKVQQSREGPGGYLFVNRQDQSEPSNILNIRVFYFSSPDSSLILFDWEDSGPVSLIICQIEESCNLLPRLIQLLLPTTSTSLDDLMQFTILAIYHGSS